MAVILPNSIMLHIPKTGGTWARKCIEAMGIPIRTTVRWEMEPNFGSTEWHHIPIYDKDWGKKPVFSFVRDPIAWYRSYWAYRKNTPWDAPATKFDLHCQAETFQEFIGKVILNYPFGYVSRLYECYTDHCEFVGRQENLQEDLLAALREYRECFDVEQILKEKVNVSDTSDLEFAPGQEEQLREIEAWVYKVFYHE